MPWFGAPGPLLQASRAVHETASPDEAAAADLTRLLRPDDQSVVVVSGPLDQATHPPGSLADEGPGGTATAPERPGYPPAAPEPWRAGLAERYRKFRAHLASPLFRNAYALMLNTGATGLLGVAYWLLAARHYPAADVGRASAAYSAMYLVSGITAYSILGAITRFIPQAGRHTSALVLRAYLFSPVAPVLSIRA